MPKIFLLPHVLLFLELFLSALVGSRNFRFASTAANLGCAALKFLPTALLSALYIVLYYACYHARGWPLAIEIPLAIAAYTFLQYWQHRWQHTVRFLWAMHSVHHQGTEFNMSLAYRNFLFIDFFEFPSSLLLAFIGIRPELFGHLVAFTNAYALLIHTELIEDIGVMGTLFTSPSHHRVHHGKNAEYLDRNYGTGLIVWDRLFGTFTRERAAPIYGLVSGFRTDNPFIANFRPLRDLFVECRRLRGWRNRVTFLLSAPGLASNQGSSREEAPIAYGETPIFPQVVKGAR